MDRRKTRRGHLVLDERRGMGVHESVRRHWRGGSPDVDGNGIAVGFEAPTCIDADLFRDFSVNGTDLGILLSQRRPNTPPAVSDLNHDGTGGRITGDARNARRSRIAPQGLAHRPPGIQLFLLGAHGPETRIYLRETRPQRAAGRLRDRGHAQGAMVPWRRTS